MNLNNTFSNHNLENISLQIFSDDDQTFIEETMKNQAVINIGTTGHVANGKSTLVYSITGVQTQKRKDEKVRNITIRLGYANAKIYKCDICNPPECYQSTSSDVMEYYCKICKKESKLKTHISFTDVPGHNLFMSTMLNGTCVMDYAILVEACSNTSIPAPQTIEHYNITKEIGIDNKLICLNKSDLVSKDEILENMQKLRDFTKSTTPVIPISGTLDCNIDIVCEHLANLKIPPKNISSNLKMLIVRSFNANKPGVAIKDLKGGIIGGSLTKGILKIGDEILIYPGFLNKKQKEHDQDVGWCYKPLKCNVLSINSENNSLQYAIAGGLIGVQLDIDPGITKDDGLIGSLIFLENDNSDKIKVYECIIVEYTDLYNRNTTEDNYYKIKKK